MNGNYRDYCGDCPLPRAQRKMSSRRLRTGPQSSTSTYYTSSKGQTTQTLPAPRLPPKHMVQYLKPKHLLSRTRNGEPTPSTKMPNTTTHYGLRGIHEKEIHASQKQIDPKNEKKINARQRDLGSKKTTKNPSLVVHRQARARDLLVLVNGEPGELEADAEAEALLQLLLRLVHGQVELVEARVGPGEGAVSLGDGLHRERPEAAVITLFMLKKRKKENQSTARRVVVPAESDSRIFIGRQVNAVGANQQGEHEHTHTHTAAACRRVLQEANKKQTLTESG